jgi:hypothetical protein
MKKYVVISLKVVVLAAIIICSFSVKPGTTFLVGTTAMYCVFWLLRGDKLVYSVRNPLAGRGGNYKFYEWSSPVKKQRAYRMAYFSNMIVFLSIFSYGIVSNHIEENNTKESIASYISYTESSEYKQKQEVFKQQFIAMRERAQVK